ncbi:hypothetical protein EVAR_87227_1 [Eumeta japonica]|uniref:Uncharacterized protein n=1 Tax=Eumeta variegata TaxID=151549 RepID=A0A4C1ZTM6_EUMVA|nr:hypothetical protein EVAR_87227_1 [Eumeta japonica]
MVFAGVTTGCFRSGNIGFRANRIRILLPDHRQLLPPPPAPRVHRTRREQNRTDRERDRFGPVNTECLQFFCGTSRSVNRNFRLHPAHRRDGRITATSPRMDGGRDAARPAPASVEDYLTFRIIISNITTFTADDT